MALLGVFGLLWNLSGDALGHVWVALGDVLGPLLGRSWGAARVCRCGVQFWLGLFSPGIFGDPLENMVGDVLTPLLPFALLASLLPARSGCAKHSESAAPSSRRRVKPHSHWSFVLSERSSRRSARRTRIFDPPGGPKRNSQGASQGQVRPAAVVRGGLVGCKIALETLLGARSWRIFCRILVSRGLLEAFLVSFCAPGCPWGA